MKTGKDVVTNKGALLVGKGQTLSQKMIDIIILNGLRIVAVDDGGGGVSEDEAEKLKAKIQADLDKMFCQHTNNVVMMDLKASAIKYRVDHIGDEI